MNCNDAPLISILIPCYNAEQWVKQAIESGLAQTWPNKEVIVVDDGSTDGSLEIVRNFGKLVRYETGPNRGGNAARNRLQELAAGDWLQYLDADDYLLPEKIERQYREMQDPSSVDVAYSPVILEDWDQGAPIGRQTREIRSRDLWVNLISWDLPQTGAALWKRSTLTEIGGWKIDQPCCQEHELYFRLLAAGKAFQFCPTPGAVYRQWSTQTVCRKNPLETALRSLAIVDAAETHLQRMGRLTEDRRDAIADARYQCARSVYQLDRPTALKIAKLARQMHPTHKLAQASCFPRAYRWVHRVAGFRAAERVAEIARPWHGLSRSREQRPSNNGDFTPSTVAERQQLLAEWNNTTTEFPRDATIHNLFREQAKRSPNSEALIFGPRRMTYAELDRRSERLASRLRSLGGGPETVVALCVPRSTEQIVAILGILKAGSAYLSLDPSNPPGRNDFLLRDSRAVVVVTSREMLAKLPGTNVPTIIIEDRDDDEDEPAVPLKNGGASAGSLAYVIYTSGSTGEPKGVMVEHRSVVRLVMGQRYATFGADRVFLQLAPTCFDASTFEIWGPLLHGATLVVAPEGPIDFTELRDLIVSHGVTTLWLTAGLFNRVVETYPSALSSVGEILTGGEALSPKHVRMAYDQLGPAIRIINGYGPTECTTFACCHSISRANPAPTGSVPIGRPIANTTVYVLDDHRRLVPIGAPGELYLGGDGVARGYLNRAELTAERFVSNPFAESPDARLYRTGDLVRWSPSGDLEFLGRLDNQVKLRGFRIELGEIEATLASHPNVRQAVVELREDYQNEKRLVAYVVSAIPASTPSESELRNFLKQTLPEYMIPAALVVLDRLPLTPNGKVDRKALPAPPSGDRAPTSGYVAPRTPLESQLAGIWGSVLRVERIGIHDDFFVYGGDSLMAAEAILRMRISSALNLSLRHLFEAPTIAGIAGIIERESISSNQVNSDVSAATRANGSQCSKNEGNGLMSRDELTERLEGVTIHGNEFDPNTFCEIIRSGDGRVPIVCLGDARPIPFMLSQTRNRTPILHLKFDGVHTWPPYYLTTEGQIDAYVRALENRLVDRTALIVGWSYGGTLAYELGVALLKRGWSDVGLFLIEPTTPIHLLPLGRQLLKQRLQSAMKLCDLRANLKYLRLRRQNGEAWSKTAVPSDGYVRWEMMVGHYERNIDSIRRSPFPRPIVFVASESYDLRFGEAWRRIAREEFERCIFSNTDDHYACFTQPRCRDQWLNCLQQWYDRFFARQRDTPIHGSVSG